MVRQRPGNRWSLDTARYVALSALTLTLSQAYAMKIFTIQTGKFRASGCRATLILLR